MEVKHVFERPKPLEQDETVIDIAAVRRQRDQGLLVSLSPAERELVEQVMRDHPASPPPRLLRSGRWRIVKFLSCSQLKCSKKKVSSQSSGPYRSFQFLRTRGSHHAKAKASLMVRKVHLSELHCALSCG